MTNLLEKLNGLILSQDIRSIDRILDELRNEQDVPTLTSLFTLYNDHYELEQIMDSITHTIETLNDRDYVKGYLDHAEHLYRSSPQWAALLLIRIVNNPSTYSNLLKSIQDRPSAVLGLIRNRAIEFKPDMPEFN
jgi:hypothetical protein